MRADLRFNLAVNEIAKKFGLMILFSGWMPTGLVKRPKFPKFTEIEGN